MDNIKMFSKGLLIGIGKIIPGVSGSMIAISLGLYEKMIDSLSSIFKNFKNNFLFLFKIGIGILTSIILISKVLIYTLHNYYFPTMLLFIGLIVGGFPTIVSIAKKNVNIKNVIILVIPFIIFLVLDILTNNVSINVKLTPINAIWVGIIEAISMIIPGISGTAIMIMIGVYDEILVMFSSFEYIYILIFFIFGVTVGIFSLCRIINYILNKYNISCYYAIIGFAVSSITIMLKQTFCAVTSYSEIIIGLILFILGVFISYKIK